MAREESRGYYQKPHQLRVDCVDLDGSTYKLVDFIADLTLGWDFSRWVILSHDEIIAGKRRMNGEHMTDLRSGLRDKKTIKKAVDDALARELIEVLYTPYGTAYAIHRRYWALAGIAPRWALFKRIPYNAISDPIPEIPAGGLNPPEDEGIMQNTPLPGGLNPPRGNTEATRQEYLTHQPVVLKLPAESAQPALPQAGREGIDTSPDTSGIDTNRIDTVAASPIGSPPSISKSEKEEHQDASQEAAEPTQEQVISSQPTDLPKQNRPTEEEKAAAHRRAVELEAARKQKQAERDRLQKAYQELERACEKLAMEHLHAWQALQKASPESEERTPLQARFDKLQLELDRTKQEMAQIEQEYKKL